MRKLRFLALPVAALLLAACKGGGVVSKLRSSQNVPGEVCVRVMECRPVSVHGTTAYVGTVRPSKEVLLTAPYPGTVESVPVIEGRKVHKGDVVAKIVSASVRSSYDMAKATLDYAEDGYARASKLHESGSVSDAKMAEIESRLRQARASHEAAAKALEDLEVKAPYDGIVGEVYAHPGEQLPLAGRLVRIVDAESVEIHFGIPEKDYSLVSVGDKVRISVPATGKDFVGMVSVKGVVASQPSHNYDCTVEGIRASSGAVPGMACKVTLERSTADGIVIPVSCVMTDAPGCYVWVVEDSRAQRRYVVTGGYAGDGVVIDSGLSEGDKVVIDGGRKVSTGMKVTAVCQD